jgi:hypothetical protein
MGQSRPNADERIRTSPGCPDTDLNRAETVQMGPRMSRSSVSRGFVDASDDMAVAGLLPRAVAAVLCSASGVSGSMRPAIDLRQRAESLARACARRQTASAPSMTSLRRRLSYADVATQLLHVPRVALDDDASLPEPLPAVGERAHTTRSAAPSMAASTGSQHRAMREVILIAECRDGGVRPCEWPPGILGRSETWRQPEE